MPLCAERHVINRITKPRTPLCVLYVVKCRAIAWVVCLNVLRLNSILHLNDRREPRIYSSNSSRFRRTGPLVCQLTALYWGWSNRPTTQFTMA